MRIPVGLVAFSFGLLPEKTRDRCLSNIDLARAVEQIVRGVSGRVVVVAQHEIAGQLEFGQYQPVELHVIRQHRLPGVYLDSEEVMFQAAAILSSLRQGPWGQWTISSVIPVAQPFLHLHRCRQLVRKAGFCLIGRPIGRIRFDRNSRQWWTRSRHELLWYAVRQMLLGRRGR